MEVSLAQAQELKGEAQFAAYAVLDATGTREVYDVLRPRLDADQERIYRWNFAQQSPALTMALRGVRVDINQREDAKRELAKRLGVATATVAADPLVLGHWDGKELETGFCTKGGLTKSGKRQRHQWPKAPQGVKLATAGMHCLRCNCKREKPTAFEPTSNPQIMHLLYDRLKVPVVRNKEGRPSCDDDALSFMERNEYFIDMDDEGLRKRKRLKGLAELIAKFKEVRDCVKQMGFLNAKLSSRNRFHSSFNVAAPWTGRWSSSKNPYREGGNLQNIGEQHRHIFVPDPGRRMFYADLKTAESLLVAYKSGDQGYIEAHKGDVHTYVCREIWPHLPWTGDIKADKKIASSNYPDWDNVPGHDYRFQSKRVQHGSNYGLTPAGQAIIARIPIKAAREAQASYFRAFPMIREWQLWTKARIEQQLPLYNALRRVVRMTGRPWDGHTHKQGYSFDAQSGVGDILNTGLWRVWRHCDATDGPRTIELLAQVHDAILGQYPFEQEAAALAALVKLMRVDVEITDILGVTRTCCIPTEIATGKNWGKKNTDPAKGRLNPEGLEEVKCPG